MSNIDVTRLYPARRVRPGDQRRPALNPRWSVRARQRYIRSGSPIRTPHTYLDGTCLFTYLGVWAVGAIHSTATLSSEGTCGLYGLRLVHRPNIFLSCFGPRAGQAVFFWPQSAANPNPILSPNKALCTPLSCELVQSRSSGILPCQNRLLLWGKSVLLLSYYEFLTAQYLYY